MDRAACQHESEKRFRLKSNQKNWLDRAIEREGLVREDYDIVWYNEGEECKIKAFTLMWWIAYTFGIGFSILGIYCFCFLSCLIG